MDINFKIANVGPIYHADIKTNGLTVLVGGNNTGKSFISRSVYILIKALINRSSNLEELLKKENVNISFLMKQKNSSSSLSLSVDKDSLIEITLDPFKFNLKETDVLTDVIYSDNSMVINESSKEAWAMDHRADLYSKLQHKDEKSPLDPETVTSIVNIFNKIFEGNLLCEDNFSCSFLYDNSYKLSMSNTSNGLKSFLILKKLFVNNHLKKGSLLILDEPEIYLHPAWQIEYAHVIAKIIAATGLRVMISTSSVHFIDALELYTKRYSLTENSNFYLGTNKDGYSSFKDMTTSMESLYEDLLKPLYYLDDLRLENEVE